MFVSKEHKIMKKILFFIFISIAIFGISTSALASTISVTFTANGQESIAVQQGDVIHVNWTSQASDPMLGCQSSGPIGVLTTMDGKEWVGISLPTSGSADLKVANWPNATAEGLQVSCNSGDWPQNAQNGSNVATSEIILLDKSVGAVPQGPVPAIVSLTPSSGPVRTVVKILGSGFTNSNDIGFVGSTNPVSGSNPNTVSPIDGEIHFTNVNSSDGKTLTFTIPSQMGQETNESGATTQPIVVPGIYYVVIETANGESGVSYFKVTDAGTATGFAPPVTTFVINQNLSLRSLGSEVTKLQSILATDSSIYPEGIISGYFGSLTQKAVQRFQCKYENICSGTPEANGYGAVDMNTRLKIEEVFGGSTNDSPGNNTPTEGQSQQDTINSILKLIQQLQAQIAAMTSSGQK